MAKLTTSKQRGFYFGNKAKGVPAHMRPARPALPLRHLITTRRPGK